MDKLRTILDFIADNWQPLLGVLLAVLFSGTVVTFLSKIDMQFVAQGAGVSLLLKIVIAVVAPWFITWQLRHMDRRLGWDFRDWFSGLNSDQRVRYASARVMGYCLFYGLLFGGV